MKTVNGYKSFNQKKSFEELFYTFSLWEFELDFCNTELNFLKKLIQSYPFKGKALNLFERIQLFVNEITNLEKQTKVLIEKIKKKDILLQSKSELDNLSCDDFCMLNYEILAEEIFDNLQNYKMLKTRIYEYMDNFIN